ncbi:MAG: hypothetical protein RL322_1673 [Pseudomonadota bacterium]
MAQLQGKRRRTDAAHVADGLRKAFLACVIVEPHASGGNPASRLNRSGFHDQEARITQRELAEVDRMPRLSAAIDRRVLAHRRNHHPIGQGQRTH